MSNVDALREALESDEHKLNMLEFEDEKVVEATAESFDTHTTALTVCIPSSEVTQEYNSGDDPNRNGKPHTLHDIFGVGGIHSELVDLLCETRGLTKRGAGGLIAENMELTEDIDNTLYFTLFLDN